MRTAAITSPSPCQTVSRSASRIRFRALDQERILLGCRRGGHRRPSKFGSASSHRSSEPSLGHLNEDFALTLGFGGSRPAKTLIRIGTILLSRRHDTGPKCIVLPLPYFVSVRPRVNNSRPQLKLTHYPHLTPEHSANYVLFSFPMGSGQAEGTSHGSVGFREALALASLSLFLATVAVWAQVFGVL